MKALWILNSPIGTAAEILGYGAASSGTWVSATAAKLQAEMQELSIDYAVLGYKDRTVLSEDGTCTVYELAIPQCRGKRTPKGSVEKWKKVIESEAPDLIHIWGTEFTNPLDVLEACEGIPVGITMQGIMTSISKYTHSDVPFHELMRGHWIAAMPAYLKSRQREKQIEKQVVFEKEILQKADTAFVDSDWAASFCRTIAPTIDLCYYPLAITPVFGEESWDADSCYKNTIFTVAPSSSMKGVHQLIKALTIVKKKFPDVRLYIPGKLDAGKKAIITEPPYFRYLRRLIKESGLTENVIFCGRLSSRQMAEHMRRANVFVMPSKAENHSSSLREAMHVGCPCISSVVGCVHEMLIHNGNTLLYRYEECEILASEIIRVLSDSTFAATIGKKGNETICKKYPMKQSMSDTVEWYSKHQKRENDV